MSLCFVPKTTTATGISAAVIVRICMLLADRGNHRTCFLQAIFHMIHKVEQITVRPTTSRPTQRRSQEKHKPHTDVIPINASTRRLSNQIVKSRLSISQVPFPHELRNAMPVSYHVFEHVLGEFMGTQLY